MEKNKSLLDDEKFQKKLAKLSPYSRMTVEQRIKESEKASRKWHRQEEALMRMPKQEKLKAICADYLGLAVDSAIGLGMALKERKVKSSDVEKLWIVKDQKTRLRSELTIRLKKFGVLPL